MSKLASPDVKSPVVKTAKLKFGLLTEHPGHPDQSVHDPAGGKTDPGASDDDANLWQDAAGQVLTHTFDGKFMKDASGTEWYVKKQKSVAQLRTEYLANLLYREVGINVPDTKLVTWGGEPAIAVKKVAIAVPPSPDVLRDAADVKRGFTADAWLANWDAVGTGYSNMLPGLHGEVVRVDHGGSMAFRAQGQPKKFDGGLPGELDSLRNPSLNQNASQVFAKVTTDDVVEGVTTIGKVPSTRIDALVAQAGFTGAAKDNLTGALVSRRNAMVEHFIIKSRPLMPPGVPDHHHLAPHAQGNVGDPYTQGHQHEVTKFGAEQNVYASVAGSKLTKPHPHLATDFDAKSFVPLTSSSTAAEVNTVAESAFIAQAIGSGHFHEVKFKTGEVDSFQHVHQAWAAGSTTKTGMAAGFSSSVFDHLHDLSGDEWKVQGPAIASATWAPSTTTSLAPKHEGFRDLMAETGFEKHAYEAKAQAEWNTRRKEWVAKLYDDPAAAGLAENGSYGTTKNSMHKAVDSYAGSSYAKWNTHFREGGTYQDASPGSKAFINAINRGALPEDTVLYRGVGGNYAGTIKGFQPGHVETELGFFSTSYDVNTPNGFGGGHNGVLLRLKVPKGYPVGWGNSGEREVVLKPHTQWRVDQVSTDGGGFSAFGNTHVIEATVIPHTEAEYLDPKNKANKELFEVPSWRTFPKCPMCKVTHKDLVTHAFKVHFDEVPRVSKEPGTKPRDLGQFPRPKLVENMLGWFKGRGITVHEHETDAYGLYANPKYDPLKPDTYTNKKQIYGSYKAKLPAHLHDPATGLTWDPTQNAVAKKYGPLNHFHGIDHEHEVTGKGSVSHKHSKSFTDPVSTDGAYHYHLPNGELKQGLPPKNKKKYGDDW